MTKMYWIKVENKSYYWVWTFKKSHDSGYLIKTLNIQNNTNFQKTKTEKKTSKLTIILFNKRENIQVNT